ncbi:hypothetical protein VTO73DRAFT_12880 [Trametes versicolor]
MACPIDPHRAPGRRSRAPFTPSQPPRSAVRTAHRPTGSNGTRRASVVHRAGRQAPAPSPIDHRLRTPTAPRTQPGAMSPDNAVREPALDPGSRARSPHCTPRLRQEAPSGHRRPTLMPPPPGLLPAESQMPDLRSSSEPAPCFASARSGPVSARTHPIGPSGSHAARVAQPNAAQNAR